MNEQMQRHWRRLTADKKKFSLVVCLSAVLLLMWGRLMLKQLPRNAVADPVTDTAQADQPADAPPVRAAPRKPAQAVTIDLDGTLRRDLFKFDATHYVKLNELINSDHLKDKSGAQAADVQQRLEDQVRQSAQGLVLQSTILGSNPRAIINGRFLAKGSKINGLEVREILPQEVVLIKDGIEVRLTM